MHVNSQRTCMHAYASVTQRHHWHGHLQDSCALQLDNEQPRCLCLLALAMPTCGRGGVTSSHLSHAQMHPCSIVPKAFVNSELLSSHQLVWSLPRTAQIV